MDGAAQQLGEASTFSKGVAQGMLEGNLVLGGRSLLPRGEGKDRDFTERKRKLCP